MNSFRKHATAKTRRPETLPDTRRTRATLFPPLIALSCAILLSVFSSAAAAQQSFGAQPPAANPERDANGKATDTPTDKATEKLTGKAAEGATEPGAPSAGARLAGLPGGLDAPMRIHLAGSPDSPVVVATIGDFDNDLGENGQFFMRREFIEHFVTNVLELGGPSHHAPMIAFLSQAEANERECTFKIGGVSGRLSVLVTPRRVFVMCSFSEDEKDTRNLARFGRPLFETAMQAPGRNG
jgi:hypothetical protein